MKLKKLMSFVLASCMAAFTFTGCQSKGQTTAQTASKAKGATVSITIWHNAEAPIANALQSELDKLKPGVNVKLERKENLSDALKLSGNDPKSAPDMYFYAHDTIGTFAQMGILSPVTDFISKDDMNDLMPMTIKAGTYKNQIYQLPVYFETLMFMYNKKLMKDPPKTTDELLKYMKDNTKDGKYGFVEQYSDSYYTAPWMHAYGASIIDENANPGLNSQQMVDALTYHKTFVPYMPKDSDYNTITTLFKEGKAHSITSGPWLVADIKKAGIDLGFAQMPTVNATGKSLSPYMGVQGMCVLSVAQSKKDAVAKVLKQLLKTNIGISLAKTANCAPANKDCYSDSDVSGNEMIKAMKKTSESVVPMPNIPETDVMWTVTANMLAAANKEGSNVKTECDKAQKDALSKISAMK